MSKTHIRFIAVIFLFAIAGQNVMGQGSQQMASVDYCDLLKNPELYDGREVTVRATYRYGFEWQELFCLSCRNLGKTWLDITAITKKSEKILKKLPKDDGTVNGVFSGIFQSSKGPFGDGGYRFRFLLKEIREVEIVTKSGADPQTLPHNLQKKLCGA